MKKECSVDGCGEDPKARGWCSKHYARWLRGGSVELPETSPKTVRLCSIKGCERKHHARGYCTLHHSRRRSLGDPLAVPRGYHFNIRGAFADRTEWDEEGCLVWTGARNEQGYGKQQFRGRVWRAHRVAWTLVNGEIPEGLFVNHNCWNRACVNVEHLNLASRSENAKYREGPQSNNALGLRNVVFVKRDGTYKVEVTDRGTTFRKHGFLTEKDAEEYAAELRGDMFGKFAGKG